MKIRRKMAYCPNCERVEVIKQYSQGSLTSPLWQCTECYNYLIP